MPRWARALLAFLALPGFVAVAIPVLLLWPGFGMRAPRTVGFVLLFAGAFVLWWRVRPVRSRLLACVILVIIAAAAGWITESFIQSSAALRFPAPGTFVDVGGRRLHLVCIGEGSPTVLIEAPGFGVSSLSAATVRARVSTEAKVCGYDRAGMGWSDPAPEALSAGTLANDLLALQDRARLSGPFIIVASSVGGLTAEMFARRHPERVVGLVFLDAASSGNLSTVAALFGVGRVATCAATASARFGLFRLIDPFDLARGVSEQVRRSAAFTYSAKSVGTLCAIVRGLPESLREFNEVAPLPRDMRLVVLSAARENAFPVPFGGSIRATRIPTHQSLANESTRGSWRMVPDSDHLIAGSHPGTVSDAILAMLADVRSTRIVSR